ncbi:MAG: DUF4190 domain-containing protein, partial [Chloroflexota bacterium]
GVVTGHLGLNKIKATGEGGRGLGIAGLILSYLGLALILCGICALVLAIVVGGASILSILSSPSFAIPTPRPFK